MARYVVAVSGGVDSVALLDMLAEDPLNELIVAHFDHGIRPDSMADAIFVEHMALVRGLPFESRREELGPNASEELARMRRYAFLRELAEKYDAEIATAHHADDAVGTIAINVRRGTGWRGVAVLDSDIVRPLLPKTKAELKEYAETRGLQWREDSTNAEEKYLRNRIRKQIKALPEEDKRYLLKLREQQIEYKKLIDEEVERLIGEGPTYSRYFFTHIPNQAAIECLRRVFDGALTRPQMERALLAIKTAKPNTTFEAGAGVKLQFTTRNFEVSLIK